MFIYEHNLIISYKKGLTYYKEFLILIYYGLKTYYLYSLFKCIIIMSSFPPFALVQTIIEPSEEKLGV